MLDKIANKAFLPWQILHLCLSHVWFYLCSSGWKYEIKSTELELTVQQLRRQWKFLVKEFNTQYFEDSRNRLFFN